LKIVAKHQSRLLSFFNSAKKEVSRLLIMTHDFPDPDSLASAYGLQHLAQSEFGIGCRIVYGGMIGRPENKEMVKMLKIPAHQLRTGDFTKYKHIALVDTQPGFKNNSLPEERVPLLVLDQHKSFSKPKAKFSFISSKSGATSAIVAKSLLALNKPIPGKVATALVYGIITDTNNLLRVAGKETIRVYTKLLPYSDLKALAKIQSPQFPASYFKTMQKAIMNAGLTGRLISIHLGDVNNHDLVPQFAELLYSYKGATVSFCTGRHHGFLRMSLRTSKPSDLAGEILRKIVNDPGEAGGHDTVGGGMIKVGKSASESDWNKLEEKLTLKLKRVLRISEVKPVVSPFRE